MSRACGTLEEWSFILRDHPAQPAFLSASREAINAFSFIKSKKIALDVVRTRADDMFFAQKKIRVLMIQALIAFCAFYNIDYMQGLNEILAPTLVIGHDYIAEKEKQDDSDDEMHVPDHDEMTNNWREFTDFFPNLIIFEQTINKLSPALFATYGVSALHGQLVSFQLLLSFFEPLLSGHLRQQGMQGEVYAVPWFITLFSRKLSIPLVLYLWQKLLSLSNPVLMVFLAVALLSDSRDELFSIPIDKLPQRMVNLKFLDERHIDCVIDHAVHLFYCVPQTIISTVRRSGFVSDIDDGDRESLVNLLMVS
jgi:hypothetical protein